MPSTSKHGLARGLPLKEVLEYLVPELNVHCLRLALNTPKVTDQLMKLDEQGVSRFAVCSVSLTATVVCTKCRNLFTALMRSA